MSTEGTQLCQHFYFSSEKHINVFHFFSSVQFSQSCPTLCNPMNHSTPGLPVHHQLPEFTQSRWCHPAISSSVVPFSSCFQSLPASGSFPMSQLFAWGGQSTGVSASASVLPMNTQDWSPLGWTGWISLQCVLFYTLGFVATYYSSSNRQLIYYPSNFPATNDYTSSSM